MSFQSYIKKIKYSFSIYIVRKLYYKFVTINKIIVDLCI